jgi:predicted nuclease with TOPRIM domain
MKDDEELFSQTPKMENYSLDPEEVECVERKCSIILGRSVTLPEIIHAIATGELIVLTTEEWEQFQQQLAESQAKKAEYQAKLAESQAKLAESQAKIAEYQAKLAEVNTKTKKLKAKRKKLKAKLVKSQAARQALVAAKLDEIIENSEVQVLNYF